MEAIEKIIARLDEQAQKERQALEKKEDEKRQQAYEARRKELEEAHQKRLQNGLNELKKSSQQQRNRQQVESNQQLLREKQALLAELFHEAARQMAQWQPEQQQAFAAQVLQRLAVSGTWVFLVGEASQAAFSAEWLTQQNARLPFQLVKAEETVPDQAGFVLQQAGVRYNFFYTRLVQEIQGEWSYELAQRFFGAEEGQ